MFRQRRKKHDVFYLGMFVAWRIFWTAQTTSGSHTSATVCYGYFWRLGKAAETNLLFSATVGGLQLLCLFS
jgi:hypothetical protein